MGVFRKRWAGGLNLLKQNMFIRLMMVFSLIASFAIAVLSYFLYTYISQSMIEDELRKQREAIGRVSAYLDDRHNSVQSFMTGIYRDPRLSQELAFYLQNNFEEYMKYRLDQSYEVNLATPRRITDTMKDTLEDNEDLRHILLYGSDRQQLNLFSKGKSPETFNANASRSYIPDVMAAEGGAVSAPNIWIRKLTGLEERGIYTVRVPVNDPLTIRNIGQLMFVFRSDAINDILASYEGSLAGHIVVMSLDGQILFDSSGKYEGRQFPYLEQISSLNGRAVLGEDSYFTTLSPYQSGYIVAGIAPVKELASVYAGMKQTIIAISLISVLIVIVLPSLVVINFAKRTYNIIRFMRKAETGDLNARLSDKREDELGQISRSFNRMLEELSRHIGRVYKAEIQQKHTELSALQARVQPHFLYNTLEVIRMRAIAGGMPDVADMIYSLAMLFKNFVRPNHDATLADELENCRLYLELFRIRYKDYFSYEIAMPPELGRQPIVRMLLQPIIENYIVHGINKERQDNWLRIEVSRRDDDIHIEVRDNGLGIPEEKLPQITSSINWPEEGEQSFGLRSVHQRLQLLYGGGYGIGLASGEAGTSVTLKFPVK